MSVLASDNFTRADNVDLGTNWDTQTSEQPWGIVSNRAETSDAGSDCGENYNAITWPNDQYSKVTLATTPVGTNDQAGIGAAVRMSAAAQTYYRGVANGGTTNSTSLEKMVAGTYSLLAQATATWAGGDTLEVQAQGTTIRVLRNGVQLISVTDNAIASGRAGIAFSSSLTSRPNLSAWEGGDFAVAAFEQEGYRFRNDDGDETTATWLAAQDTNITLAAALNARLRLLIDSAGADPATQAMQLEYRKVGSTNWHKVGE